MSTITSTGEGPGGHPRPVLLWPAGRHSMEFPGRGDAPVRIGPKRPN